MPKKERQEWINWVNESITFYSNKINELNEILENKTLSHEERQIIEAEIASAIEDKKKWQEAQNELKN